MKLISFVLVIIVTDSLFGQLDVNSDIPVNQIVLQDFLENNLSVSNITFNGSAAVNSNGAVAGFVCTDCNIQIPEGMLLTTGIATEAIGPNNDHGTSGSSGLYNGNDPDIASIVGSLINDWAILEFDFVANSGTIDLSYVFASEEYSAYVNSSFSDGFGIFLSGPGISGPFSNSAMNIAVLPGTNTSIAVNNINNGVANSGPCDNCQYYNQECDPETSIPWPLDPTSEWYTDPHYVQFDGYTDILHATAEVICGETYHLKIVIADSGDSAFDSAVFLESTNLAGSNTAQVTVEFEQGGPNGDTLLENCGAGIIRVHRPEAVESNTELAVNLTYSGNASMGIDYTNLPSVIIIPAGEEFVEIPIDGLFDDLDEGSENIIIVTSHNGDCNGFTLSQSFEFFISDDVMPLIVSEIEIDICPGITTIVEPEFSGGSGSYTFEWSNGATTENLEVIISEDQILTVTMSDGCGSSDTGSIVLNSIDSDPLTAQLEDSDDILPLNCNGFGSLSIGAAGGLPPYSISLYTDEGTSYNYFNNVVFISASTVGTLYLEVHDQCNSIALDSIEVTVNAPALSVTGPEEIVPCGGEYSTTIVANGGVSPITYNWFLDGVYQNHHTATYSGTTTTGAILMASAVDNCGQIAALSTIIIAESESIEIIMENEISGCTGFPLLITPVLAVGDQDSLFFEWSMSGEILSESMEYSGVFQENTMLTLSVSNACGIFATYDVQLLPFENPNSSCAGDFDTNGVVTTTDVIVFLYAYGCIEMCCEYDLNDDDIVSISDLFIIIENFGVLCD